MNNIITLKIPCSPAISTELKCIGERHLIHIQSNGGIGGSYTKVVGQINASYGQNGSSLTNKNGNYEVILTESQRKMEVSPQWVSLMENVKLWKQTHKHNNPNFEGDTMIRFIYSKGMAELQQGNSLTGNDENHPLIGYIEESSC